MFPFLPFAQNDVDPSPSLQVKPRLTVPEQPDSNRQQQPVEVLELDLTVRSAFPPLFSLSLTASASSPTSTRSRTPTRR